MFEFWGKGVPTPVAQAYPENGNLFWILLDFSVYFQEMVARCGRHTCSRKI